MRGPVQEHRILVAQRLPLGTIGHDHGVSGACRSDVGELAPGGKPSAAPTDQSGALQQVHQLGYIEAG